MLDASRRPTRRRRPGALGALLGVAICLSAGVAAAQTSEENTAAARALALQGAGALKAGRFAETVDLVSRAEALHHAPTHLLMIARAQVGLGKLVAAQETYLKILHEDLPVTAPAAFKHAQTSAREELAGVEPRIASLRLVAPAGKATVKLDDEIVPPALLGVYRPIDPGHHVAALYPVGGSPVTMGDPERVPHTPPVIAPIDLHDGERREIRLAAPGAPANAADNPDASTGRGGPVRDQASGPGFFTPLRGAGVGLAAAGVAGVVVGSIFLAKGFSTARQADSLARMVCQAPAFTACPLSVKGQLQGLDDDAAHQKTIGVIALPIGVAALGAGAALIVLGKPRAAPGHASVEPWFSGTMGGIRGEL